MNENQELIDLCTNCNRTDCDGTPCSDYRAIERRTRTAQSRSRYRDHGIEPEITPVQAETCSIATLMMVNRVIDALEALLRDPDADLFLNGRGAAGRLIEHMKRMRFNHCQHLIDWNTVIKNIQEDKSVE